MRERDLGAPVELSDVVDSRSAPPELRRLLDDPPLTGKPFRVLSFLAEHFGQSVTVDEIVFEGLGEHYVGDAQYMKTKVSRVRAALPLEFSVYLFRNYGRYMLSHRLEDGGSIFPDFLREGIAFASEDVLPLLTHYNVAEPKDPNLLVTRLPPKKITLLNALGVEYPSAVANNALVASLWGDHVYPRSYLPNLRNHIYGLGKRMDDDFGGEYQIEHIDGIGYKLELANEMTAWTGWERAI